ncbi:DUF2971 domain-containing protein [Agromyces atrinae]|uniref:DUF2971 domain-containing protein n=1 Tax=Agromyces atrinae TaxID=592376 RepID=UPI001F571105|nr:DUF2971 domain-containing protein [Agromyces atrinae]MCI2958662.1 DUF2971 domain-containing protein [Agromyces atrinae]
MLNQWQHYATSEGFSIELGTEHLKTWWRPTSYRSEDGRMELSTVMPGWYPAIYDEDEQIKIARRTIKFAAEAIDFHISEKLPNASPSGRTRNDVVRAMVAAVALQLKPPAYADEREIRFIAGVEQAADVQFREAAGRIVPYISVSQFRSEKKGSDQVPVPLLPIRSVTCGPTCRQGTDDVVRRLLRSHGYGDLPVQQSTIPYVGRR